MLSEVEYVVMPGTTRYDSSGRERNASILGGDLKVTSLELRWNVISGE